MDQFGADAPSASAAPEPADPSAAPAAPLVQVVGLRKEYSSTGRPVIALDGVSLEVGVGVFCAIMGASGSGKSTLMHVIGGLTPPTAGDVFVAGQNIARLSDRARTLFRRRRMGIIFQEYNLLPTLTAWENIGLPQLIDGRAAHEYGPRVDELLRLVHLEARGHHRPAALSGGEQQRVAIARALLSHPALILADEPTGNLDSRQACEIWQLLARVAREQQMTILMVTHEAAGAAYADRVIVLRDGRVLGELEPKGCGDAALVATGYQKLTG